MNRDDQGRRPTMSLAQHACLMAMLGLSERLGGAGITSKSALFFAERFFTGNLGNSLRAMRSQDFLFLDPVTGLYHVLTENVPSRTEHLIGIPPARPFSGYQLDRLAAWIRSGVEQLLPEHVVRSPDQIAAPAKETFVYTMSELEELQHLSAYMTVVDAFGQPLPEHVAGEFFRLRITDAQTLVAFFQSVRKKGLYGLRAFAGCDVLDEGRQRIKWRGIAPQMSKAAAAAFLVRYGVAPKEEDEGPIDTALQFLADFGALEEANACPTSQKILFDFLRSEVDDLTEREKIIGILEGRGWIATVGDRCRSVTDVGKALLAEKQIYPTINRTEALLIMRSYDPPVSVVVAPVIVAEPEPEPEPSTDVVPEQIEEGPVDGPREMSDEEYDTQEGCMKQTLRDHRYVELVNKELYGHEPLLEATSLAIFEHHFDWLRHVRNKRVEAKKRGEIRSSDEGFYCCGCRWRVEECAYPDIDPFLPSISREKAEEFIAHGRRLAARDRPGRYPKLLHQETTAAPST